MNFPADWTVLTAFPSNALTIVISLVMFGAGVVFAGAAIFFYREHKKFDWKLALNAFVFTLIPAILLYTSYRDATDAIAAASQFRVDPSQIVEIRIERVPKEGTKAIGEVKILTDRALIADGFKQLSTARGYIRSHETFVDGYRIQIKLEHVSSYSTFYYSVFKGSEARSLPVVILHKDRDDTRGVGENFGGIYECRAFYQWMIKNIDPLFEKT